MRQDEFEFQPEFKLIVSGNDEPQIESIDQAMRRRFFVIPFDQQACSTSRVFGRSNATWGRLSVG